LAKAADVTFVGVGQMGDDAPLLADGFVSRSDLSGMQAQGAVGEVAGWVFDAAGHYLDLGTNHRVGGVRITPGLDRPVIGVAAGVSKVAAITAALSGRILNGLVTDEDTARAILSRR
jgi:DNA-binding transcriptional regulator LsrR (DeoR family)